MDTPLVVFQHEHGSQILLAALVVTVVDAVNAIDDAFDADADVGIVDGDDGVEELDSLPLALRTPSAAHKTFETRHVA